MKKLLAVIGVLFAIVVGLAVYNNCNKTVQPQPQPTSSEPTVSAPETNIIVATGNVTPTYK